MIGQQCVFFEFLIKSHPKDQVFDIVNNLSRWKDLEDTNQYLKWLKEVNMPNDNSAVYWHFIPMVDDDDDDDDPYPSLKYIRSTKCYVHDVVHARLQKRYLCGKRTARRLNRSCPQRTNLLCQSHTAQELRLHSSRSESKTMSWKLRWLSWGKRLKKTVLLSMSNYHEISLIFSIPILTWHPSWNYSGSSSRDTESRTTGRFFLLLRLI